MPDKLYHATTYRPEDITLEGSLVRRTRVINLISSAPGPGVISWIVGPLGSGKSTIARQWALDQDYDVQLVTARPEKHGIKGQLKPPSPLGLALQDLLNACSREDQPAPESEIAAALEQVVQRSLEERQVFILDDLELIRRDSMNILQKLFMHALPRLRIHKGIVVSRTIDVNILNALQDQRSMRMVLPSSLEFDQDEAAEAHRIGVFGTATLEEVGAARERSAGWISGMLTDLHGHGGSTISKSAFSTNILNDMLLYQPTPILRCIYASAFLPFTTMEIWERWFTRLQVPIWAIASTLTQIPTRKVPDHHDGFEVVPPMREALRSFSSIGIEEADLHELLVLAMEVFIRNNEIEVAKSIAINDEIGLINEYFTLVKPVAEAHAKAEDWQAIKSLMDGLPEELVHSDGDLHFWMEFALANNAEVSKYIYLHQMYASDWEESENDLDRGRHFLILGFIARGKGEVQPSFEHFEHAYNALPPTAHQERLYAAASAANASSHISIDRDITQWRNKVAYELAHLPASQRWWNSDANPVALGFVASSGQLNLSYNMTLNQIDSLSKLSPEHSWRYFLHLACIDIERMDLDAADQALERAHSHIENVFQTGMLQVVRARLLSAKGEHKAASAALYEPAFQLADAITNGFRFKMTEADIAVKAGEPESADLILGMTAWPSDPFPRNFGDPHPLNILAMVRAETGKFDEALSHVHQVLEESRQRGNRHLEIRSLVILAHIHHRQGADTERDQVIQEAVSLNNSIGFQHVFFILGRDIRELVGTHPVVASNNSASRLSSRELEVLRLAADSLSNKQIAESMFISVSTVKNHLASVYDKLGTNNRRAAVQIARELTLIPK